MSSTQTTPKQKRIVGQVLSQAVKLWLRSQAEHLDALEINISGNNRSILTGHIAQVTVQAAYAVYRGLHLSQIDLCGRGIHINIGQVLKGKPLQLLKPFPVNCDVCLLADDLNTSLQSPLLINAIAQHLLPLIQSQNAQSGATPAIRNRLARSPLGGFPDLKELRKRGNAHQENRNFYFPSDIKSLQDLTITLAPNQLTLTAEICSTDDQLIAFSFQTELYLASPTELLLASGRLELLQQHYQLENMTLDLGTDVSLESLNISSEKLEMKGEIQVNP